MEITDSNLMTLSTYLQQTLSADVAVRKPAEKFLESVESNQGYPVLLLQLIDKNDVEITIRVAGAIVFKNYIKRNWKVDEDSADKIHSSDRETIKRLIVGLMLKNPEQIQRQLSDAISKIGHEDFPAKWPDLIPNMVSHFQSGDFYVINGVLHTANSIFKRYRYEFKSMELWSEIKFVLDNFAKPLTDLLNVTMELAAKHATNPQALKVIFSSLGIIAKIFYSLNFQDLPEFFEDNMETWMNHFHTLLTTDNQLLKTGDDEEAGLLEQLKSQICDNVAMYAQKYDEEFRPYLPNFVTAVWKLLTSTGSQPKYDLLVSNAIQFLASVADRPHYKQLFEGSAALHSICEKVILPNMEFRTADEELFEDNPEEYIRKDIEGSDVDTRRRAACDLVKSLSKFFEAEMTEVFSQYVITMLQSYASNPKDNWKHKDVAIYLVTSLAAKAQTAKHGITQINQLVNLVDFLKEHVMPDLQSSEVNVRPVLKADAIKYIMVFRNQLPFDALRTCLPCLVRLLTSESQVVHTYAAHCIERFFTIRKQPENVPLFGVSDVQSVTQPLLQNLFSAFNIGGSSENDYVMKTIMRTFSLLQEAVIPYLGDLLPRLTQILSQVCKNPSKPHFNHYLFETLSLSIRIVCKGNPAAVSNFEQALFPVFEGILQQDVQEFIPYVFQVMSLLLELHSKTVPEPYMVLFPCLLFPALWERHGNIRPLVRLLQAYIEKGAEQIVASDKLSGLLGVYQKLLASKANDHEGFYLMMSITENVAKDALMGYMRQVFLIIFQRLHSSKTTKFVRSLLVFFCNYAIKFGSDALIQVVDSIQAKLFSMVVERLMIPDLQKVSGSIERKICAVGVTKILCESPATIAGDYSNLWAPLLQALIGLFELPEDETVPDDEHFVEIEETPGYQTAYSQLVFAGKKEFDPLNGLVSDVRVYLAESLQKASVAHPNTIGPLINTSLNPDAAAFLARYIADAKVTLS